MFLLDLTHTSHTRARTGIQRVARALHRTLGPEGCGLTWDPHARHWRTLEPWEEAALADTAPAPHRGAQWPWPARLRGYMRRATGQPSPRLPAATGLIVPELFSPAVATALPALLASVRGPRVALFHDAIALKFPELSPARTVARFPAYLQELLAFDGIAAVSADSRDTLLGYWRWLGATAPPPVVALPLGLDDLHLTGDSAPGVEAPPVVLCVGSIEGRKNHPALLEAAESLWALGRQFELHLVGLAHPQTGRNALDHINRLQATGRPLRYAGSVDDATLHRAYARCAFTVYPSLVEGFGLPVLESLAHGKPCICSAGGALGESARDGGCLMLGQLNAPDLAEVMDRLLSDERERESLACAARARRFRQWSEYVAELTTWMKQLPPR